MNIKEKVWSEMKIYNGNSILNLIEQASKLVKVAECGESKVSIEDYSEISNGICKFKYSVWNYDISQDELYAESEVSFMTLFDFIKDNNLCPIGTTVKEFIIDDTRDCLKYYILHQRKN